MVDLTNRPTLGPYVLTRPLPACALAERWLAVHPSSHTSHVAYRFGPCTGRTDQKRFLEAANTAAALCTPHVLRIEDFAFDQAGCPFIITPFGGDADGVRTLGALVRQKNGQLTPAEADHAVTQILEAVRDAHSSDPCVVHGPISPDDVLVDRHGKLAIELYGLARLLRRDGVLGGSRTEVMRDEVRSVVELAYQLVTGLRAEEPLIPAGRLVKRLDPRWDAWLWHGLDPVHGYASASEALELLPSRLPGTEQPDEGGVRAVLRRLRAVSGTR